MSKNAKILTLIGVALVVALVGFILAVQGVFNGSMKTPIPSPTTSETSNAVQTTKSSGGTLAEDDCVESICDIENKIFIQSNKGDYFSTEIVDCSTFENSNENPMEKSLCKMEAGAILYNEDTSTYRVSEKIFPTEILWGELRETPELAMYPFSK